jgi:hypothetical protein
LDEETGLTSAEFHGAGDRGPEITFPSAFEKAALAEGREPGVGRLFSPGLPLSPTGPGRSYRFVPVLDCKEDK